ncbi:hypothetical protein QYE76_068079 [Lolium multiflorum]|uniref:Uncharacterized protein n=1 Tax=Lolium multiflorum TaxID=4521 RepID=A0AAD8SEK4_LOLMU|nr:hypothetical protein QYE76_068079 [Lolium multiflorum]
MAADAGRRLDVANLLSFGDDLVGVLLDRKDAESLAQAYDGARMLRSACHSESRDLQLQVKDYQDKINSCKENTEVSDELDNLDLQRASIEERKNAVKKKEKDMLKAQSMLSMCVSVTNIMPNFEDQDKISGYTVDKNMKKLEKFQFEKTMSPVEICDKFWKMI